MAKKSHKLPIFIITFVLSFGFLILTSKVMAQTNQVYCILDTVTGICIPDETISPNPDCNSGSGPPCAGSTGAACCTSQGASCNNVDCTPLTTCPPGSICIGVPSDFQCTNRGGIAHTICTIPAGQTGVPCCVPTGTGPDPCDPGSHCIIRNRTPCEDGAGTFGECFASPTGTCCCPDGSDCLVISGPGTTTPYGAPPSTVSELYDRIELSPEEIAASAYKILLPIVVILGVVVIAAAGYMFMTSQGQPDKVKEAGERLTAAVVGIVFVVLSLVILRVIINTLLK